MDAETLQGRTRRFALAVIDICMTLTSDELGRLVRPQLLRAGTGVAANYRAACRGRTPREFASRLAIVVEEADESELWLDILIARGHGRDEVLRQRAEAIELPRAHDDSRTS